VKSTLKSLIHKTPRLNIINARLFAPVLLICRFAAMLHGYAARSHFKKLTYRQPYTNQHLLLSWVQSRKEDNVASYHYQTRLTTASGYLEDRRACAIR